MQTRTITINSRKSNKNGWTRRPGTRLAAAVAAAMIASAVGLATPSSARLDEPVELPAGDAPLPLPPPVSEPSLAPAAPAAPTNPAAPAIPAERPEKVVET